MLKNIEKSTVLNLADQIAFHEGQVSSKTLVQNKGVGLTLFSIPQGEGISAHKAPGDALVTVLEGKARITIDQTDYEVSVGESIVMPANIPHALYGIENFKFFLTVVFPTAEEK